jgi:hypothetical protein
MSLPPDAGLARVVLDGEALTRLALTLEAERAKGDCRSASRQQEIFAALRSNPTPPTEDH